MKCRNKKGSANDFAFRITVNFVRKTATIVENLYCLTILI